MPEAAQQAMFQYGALGVVAMSLLGCLIWTVRFVLTRLETAIRENTHAVKNLQQALAEHDISAPRGHSPPGSKAY